MIAPVTPRPAATVMLLRDAEEPAPDGGVEVLLLERSGRTAFVPGAHVFPGGAVEARDAHAAVADVVEGLDDTTASAILGVDAGGLAFWVAAVRECFEEAGILLAGGEHGHIDDDHPALAEPVSLRADIESGRLDLIDHLTDHGLRLRLDQVSYVARWITPEESPRRYDTRFFAAAMPPAQQASADDWEAVSSRWWRPSDALAGWQAGQLHLIEPTVSSLRLLTTFTGAHDALDAFHAGSRRPERIAESAGGVRVPLPVEPPASGVPR